MLVDTEGSRLLGASYWDSAESLRASEDKLAEVRTAGPVGREMNIERRELVVGFRHSIPGRGALVRMAWFEVDPARIEETLSVMREENVPSVKGAEREGCRA